MTDKKKPKRRTGKPHEAKGNVFVEATHQVIEDEVRKGDAPAAPDPDQKGEPRSRV